jgi:hypothetical protein
MPTEPTADPTQRDPVASVAFLASVAVSGPAPRLLCYLKGWKENVAVTLVPVSLMLLAVTPE